MAVGSKEPRTNRRRFIAAAVGGVAVLALITVGLAFVKHAASDKGSKEEL